jgi:hypothetical protein
VCADGQFRAASTSLPSPRRNQVDSGDETGVTDQRLLDCPDERFDTSTTELVVDVDAGDHPEAAWPEERDDELCNRANAGLGGDDVPDPLVNRRRGPATVKSALRRASCTATYQDQADEDRRDAVRDRRPGDLVEGDADAAMTFPTTAAASSAKMARAMDRS